MLNSYRFELQEGPFEFTDEADDLPFGRKNIKYSFEINDDACWDEVLRNFLNFLSSVYGYDIAEQLKEKGFE